jgi:hypothetical protein
MEDDWRNASALSPLLITVKFKRMEGYVIGETEKVALQTLIVR